MKIVTGICKLCCKWQFNQKLNRNENAAHNFVTCKKCRS